MAETLRDLVEAELGQPVDPRVAAMAEAIAAKHGTASRAVLFYGSCLREKQLDGLMLDFYLIVSDYRSAYGKGWLATANTLVPPNVFPFQRGDLAAKYAVLSERDFYRLNGPETRNVSVWARFAQPSRLVWSADQAAAETAVAAVSRAAPTLLAAAGRVEGETALDWWRRAFSLTYSAELRAERKGRAGSVIDADLERYERFSPAVIAAIDPAIAGGGWLHRRIEGKLLSVLRLAKASATYAGGAEYIAWKINRHAGTDIELKPWQKRHPLIAAISLLPRLLRSGAIR
jgi:FAD/FMN-containing dehydrogenase